MSFKTLHSFVVNLDKEVEETETRTENGQEISIKRKLTKPVPHTIVMKEPTRREKQTLSFFHAKSNTDAIKEGLAPKALLIQSFSRNPNSPLSQEEDKNLKEAYVKLEEIQNDLVRIKVLPDSDDTKNKRDKLLYDLQVTNKKIMDIESAYQSLFAYTAENFAANRAISWLVMSMSYLKDGENYTPIFPGKDFEEREEAMFAMDERKDSLLAAISEKLSLYWTFYFQGVASSTEEFTKMEEELTKQLEAAKKAQEEADKKAKEKVEAEKAAGVTPAPANKPSVVFPFKIVDAICEGPIEGANPHKPSPAPVDTLPV